VARSFTIKSMTARSITWAAQVHRKHCLGEHRIRAATITVVVAVAALTPCQIALTVAGAGTVEAAGVAVAAEAVGVVVAAVAFVAAVVAAAAAVASGMLSYIGLAACADAHWGSWIRVPIQRLGARRSQL